AEDGIRDFHVTGVQTCALPISRGGMGIVGANWDVTEDIRLREELLKAKLTAEAQNKALEDAHLVMEHNALHDALTRLPNRRFLRSEERRVGKECRPRWTEEP